VPAAWPLRAPDPATIPDGPLGDAIRQGQALVTQTDTLLPANTGAALRCTSCHLQGGTVAGAGPWVGLPAVFPEHRTRNDRVNTLEQRINDCFERSVNGRPLDPTSPEMSAIVAYMTWLSQGVPIGVPVEGRGFPHLVDPPEADPTRGAAVYAARCAACHGADGDGRDGPDGRMLFPPLWGDRSFNIAAGMARLDTAAAFVKANMPLGQGGTLTDQEAVDVAAYFTTQDRPDFAGKATDWPRGGRPRDARY
jgi:thiosulfate dehydrogenase